MTEKDQQDLINSKAELAELEAQRSKLDQEIQLKQRVGRNIVLQETIDIVRMYGLTASELYGHQKGARKSSREPAEAKYRDTATGKTWSGRGKPPLWIAGKDRAPFAITAEQQA